MTRPVTFETEEFYHVYNRGTEKRRIFLSKSDYARFVALLYVCNQNKPVSTDFRGPTSEVFSGRSEETLVDIVAYCLMPNHFHLLVRTKESADVGKFMQKLSTGYTMYFNKRYERSGVLFQGKFKATHVHDDEYLKYLVSYIHLNPIKLFEPKWKEVGISDRGAALKFLSDFHHSSFIDYQGGMRAESSILNMPLLLDYFDSPADLVVMLKSWLEYKT